MKLKREVIIFGDIEIGAGNLTDDFISDKAIYEIFIELSKRKHPVDLILNGDTFDFLKCPVFDRNQFVYPRHITEEVSLNKLKLMNNAHSLFFNGLKKFVSKKKNRLYFIIGNHDFDLVYEGVQEELRRSLKNKNNIYFQWNYIQDGIYAEHGHQYDFLNKLNLQKLFLYYKGKQILNLSFVSLSIITAFLHMKEDNPFLERIFPRPNLFSFHRSLVKRLTRRSIVYFFKTILYYPFRYMTDPTYSLPKELFREFYLRWKKVQWDVDEVIHIFKRKRLKENKIYILGHVHEKYVEDRKGKILIHPGSWRDEYDLDSKTRKLIPRSKRYVQIIINEDAGLEYQLIDFPIERSISDFDNVVNNELFYVKKAAKEEGFESGFI